MIKKIYIDSFLDYEIVKALQEQKDIHVACGPDDVRVTNIHLQIGECHEIYDATCDVVYPSGGKDTVKLTSMNLYRYDFKDGDYARDKDGSLCILGPMDEVQVFLHAVVNDDGLTITNDSKVGHSRYLLGHLHPCKEWEKRAIDNELLRIGKWFNKETKRIEDIQKDENKEV